MPHASRAEFPFRNSLSSENMRRFHTTSFQHISELLKQRPPSAILVGFEGTVDSPFEDFAIENGYEKREDIVQGGRLYISRRKISLPNQWEE
ncbi:MAG: hypothetical protein KJ922_03470 [Nanoarchaeota archaeon]|nr:hypothetical protein [Nanoarchaeota archaeon]